MINGNCNNASLTLHTTPLTFKEVQHLYKRIGFNAPYKFINSLVGKTANELINMIIDEAIASPFITKYEWAEWDENDYPPNNAEASTLRNEQYEELKYEYVSYLLASNLRGRLSFFWSNHFVADRTSHFCYSYQYEYLECLHRNALGNFKQFTEEIGLTSAMLFYLDGAFSTKENPNENYARELYELFTLGEGNGYVENDIIETAKALTGYFNGGTSYVGCSFLKFDTAHFDDSQKTIFEKTDNFDYYGVINNLFDKKSTLIARYICSKLYTFFVQPDHSTTEAQLIIDELSQTFLDNDFEIIPVLKQLLKSEHFFNEASIGVIIKSPFDLFLNLINELSLTVNDSLFSVIQQGTRESGQTIFSPPDVAGWQRDRSWINNNYVISRWNYANSFNKTVFFNDNEYYRIFALELVGDIGVTSNNPDSIAKVIIDYFLPRGLKTVDDYNVAYVSFRNNIPDLYFEGGEEAQWTLKTWSSVPTQVYFLLDNIVKQPEFQLK